MPLLNKQLRRKTKPTKLKASIGEKATKSPRVCLEVYFWEGSDLRGLEADVELDRVGVELITGIVNGVGMGSGNALWPNVHFYREDTTNCVRF